VGVHEIGNEGGKILTKLINHQLLKNDTGSWSNQYFFEKHVKKKKTVPLV
jgi:hypothetical protein